MNQYLSDKIKLLSLVLILLVLYIHSGFKVEGMYWNNLIQDLIGDKIGRLAVPSFFVISGYLFFINTDKGFSKIKIKIRKRFWSVFLPYIYACLLFIISFTVIQLIPGVSKYMNWNILPLYRKQFWVILKEIFWMMNNSNSPIPFHLWFLRDLILIIILSPIIYLILKHMKWFGIFILFLAAALNINSYPVSLTTSLCWFSLGGILSFNKTPKVFIKFKWGFLLFVLYLILVTLEDFIPNSFYRYINELLIIMGMLGIWFLYDNMVSNNFNLNKKETLSYVCDYTFFIYLIHEPIINIIRKSIILVLGKEAIAFLLSYLLSPIILIITAIFIASQLKKHTPKIYSNFVGGRI